MADKKTDEEKLANRLMYINKEKAAFLEGKKPEYVSSFEAKDADKQYNSIASWKSKNNTTTKKIKSGKLCSTFVAILKDTNKKIAANDELTDEELGMMIENLNAISATITSYKEKVKVAKKAKLEAEIRKMQAELQALENKEAEQ